MTLRKVTYAQLAIPLFIPGVGSFTDKLTTGAQGTAKDLEMNLDENGSLHVTAKIKGAKETTEAVVSAGGLAYVVLERKKADKPAQQGA